MSVVDETRINSVLTTGEEEITRICSPFSGHCFEIAISIANIVTRNTTEQSVRTQFFEIHSEPEFAKQPTMYPSVIPRHIAVSINGTLFDAAGRTTTSELLTEYVPWEDECATEYTVWKDTFEHNDVLDEDIYNTVETVYEEILEEKT